MAFAGDAAKVGDVVFQLNLSDPAVKAMLEAQGATVIADGYDGQPAVCIDQEKATAQALSIPLDLIPLRGTKLFISATLKADNIRSGTSVPITRWNGVKCLLTYDSSSRGFQNWEEGRLHESFPWKKIGVICGITDDAKNGQLVLGVKGGLGTVLVTDLQVSVLQTATERPAEVAAEPPPETTLRGFMSPPRYHEKDFAAMGALRANLIRWQLVDAPRDLDLNQYDKWLDAKLDELELVLKTAEANHIKVIVDLHSPPGGRMLPDATLRMVLEKKYGDEFIAIWQRIATRFKDSPALYAYDLVNEPVQNHLSPAGVKDWFDLEVAAAKAIRAIDPKNAIVFEVDRWCQPDQYLWLKKPIDVTNIIYELHMYWPGDYTNQGVFTDQGIAKDADIKQIGRPYPGDFNGHFIDKAALIHNLKPVRDFQLAYHVPIYVGEFSVVRWAPGADRYLDDCISIFESYGWNWTYHAFREWGGWSLEAADLPYNRTKHPLATEPTDRLLVVEKWLAKNQPPQPAQTVQAVSP